MSSRPDPWVAFQKLHWLGRVNGPPMGQGHKRWEAPWVVGRF
jgi:hypothetical protein